MSSEKQIEEMAKAMCRNAMPNGNCATDDEPCALECVYGYCAERLYCKGYRKQEWISVEERLPKEFVSVLGYMTDAEGFPPVRECYMVGRVFFFPALRDVRPVSHWMPLPEAPKMKGGAE